MCQSCARSMLCGATSALHGLQSTDAQLREQALHCDRREQHAVLVHTFQCMCRLPLCAGSARRARAAASGNAVGHLLCLNTTAAQLSARVFASRRQARQVHCQLRTCLTKSRARTGVHFEAKAGWSATINRDVAVQRGSVQDLVTALAPLHLLAQSICAACSVLCSDERSVTNQTGSEQSTQLRFSTSRRLPVSVTSIS